MDCSISDPAETERRGIHFAGQPGHSHLLINATMKWPYPPISLPKKEFMENALRIWREEGFPALELKWPWYGYSLGRWNEEQDQHAMLAVKGEYKQVGDILAQRRTKIK
jgi:4-hydroxy-3-polyprenylbenzoate decarboxylase